MIEDDNRDSLQYITNFEIGSPSVSPGNSPSTPSTPSTPIMVVDEEINTQLLEDLETSLNQINEELAESTRVSDSENMTVSSSSDSEDETTTSPSSEKDSSDDDSSSSLESDEIKRIIDEVDSFFDDSEIDLSDIEDEVSGGVKSTRKKKFKLTIFTLFVTFCGFCLYCTMLVAIGTIILRFFGEGDLVDFWRFARATNYHLIQSRKIEFIDAHGHIFNADFVPSDVIPEFVYGLKDQKNEDLWDGIKDGMSKLSEILDDLNLPDWLKPDGFQFLEAAAKSMEKLLDEWLETIHKQMNRDIFSKHAEAAVIALPVDMDIGYKFTSSNRPYIQQFWETKRVCDEYNKNRKKKGLALYGFALDPRKLEGIMDREDLPLGYYPPLNETETQAYLSYLQSALSSGAVACKVYPSMGFLPTHPVLMKKIWPKFEEVGIPVYTHCSDKGIHFAGRTISYLNPKSPTGVTTRTFNNQKEKAMFNHPSAWEPVIRNFPKLKVNFAHFGGAVQLYEGGEDNGDNTGDSDDDINEDSETGEEKREQKNKIDKNWDEGIIKLMKMHPSSGVFTDVSHFWTKAQYREAIRRVFEHRVWGKLLFGTDYYISQITKKTRKVISRFIDEVNWAIGVAVAYDNIIEFLKPNDGAESFIENEIITSSSTSLTSSSFFFWSVSILIYHLLFSLL